MFFCSSVFFSKKNRSFLIGKIIVNAKMIWRADYGG